MHPIIRIPPSAPAAIPATIRALAGVRYTGRLAAISAASACVAIVRSAPLGLLLFHQNLRELSMLFENRDHLLDQSLEFLITRVLFILLQLADQFVVIGAAFLKEDSVKVGALRRLQFPFEFLLTRSLMSGGLMRFGATLQISPAVLRHRNYHLIDLGMILDELIRIRPNLAAGSFPLGDFAQLYLHQVRLMHLRKNQTGVRHRRPSRRGRIVRRRTRMLARPSRLRIRRCGFKRS